MDFMMCSSSRDAWGLEAPNTDLAKQMCRLGPVLSWRIEVVIFPTLLSDLESLSGLSSPS